MYNAGRRTQQPTISIQHVQTEQLQLRLTYELADHQQLCKTKPRKPELHPLEHTEN